ncbi:MAG TPA: hypothetical protein VFX53_04580 [Pedococcus sp.]|nr:hypothetical protein [Pedococcus sp.]
MSEARNDTEEPERVLSAEQVAVAPFAIRLARIAEAHHMSIDRDGGTYGDCNECGWAHPCPTYVWATTDRDPLSTWDPADDDGLFPLEETE